MIGSWRPPVLAAVFFVIVVIASSAVATAQTVIVRGAPPGGTTEVIVRQTPSGSATVDTLGDATVLLNPPAVTGNADLVVNVFVDECGTTRRVVLVERGLQPLPSGSCTRRGVGGAFVMRRVTTLVLDLASSVPTLRLSQGPAPAAWLRHGPELVVRWPSERSGAVFSAGGTFARYRDVVASFCDDTDCSGEATRPAVSIGGTYWLTRFIGIQGTYLKPSEVTASGSGSAFRFDSTFEADVYTLAANVGGGSGRFRLYGQAGANLHRAAADTRETIDAITVIVDDEPQVVPGGPYTLVLRTKGWGWLFGGGMETWLTPRFGVYAEGSLLRLKGTDINGGERGLDDRLFSITVGGRIYFGS